MKSVLLLVVLMALFAGALSQTQYCPGTPNTNPVFTDSPVLVNEVPNGKLYVQGNTTVTPNLLLLSLWGTPYEMGYAHGQLLAPQIKDLFPQLFEWLYGQVEAAIPFLPKFLQNIIAKDGIAAALDATYYLTKDFTPSYFYEELKGIADGSGLDEKMLIQVHMLPELIKAHCSMFGAWGPATANTAAKGELYQLRSLDWSANGPFQQYPMVLTYHPAEPSSQSPGGHPFSILTWAGFIGALTGVSSSKVGVCEKVWLAYNETSSRAGIPFYFLMRDILQFDNSSEDALARIFSAHRTCSIWLGVGDADPSKGNGTFDIVDYSVDELNVYNDQNFPAYPPVHPKMNGVAFVDKHVQPSSDPCLGSLLEQYYGSIDPQVTLQYITAQHQTGNMHIGIYDYQNRLMYVSNAGVYDVQTNYYENAFDRTFIQVPVGQMWDDVQQ